MVVHRGAGAYICGEETGLISSLEGKKGWPKVKPPFPAIKGAFGQPTVVNNVETLAAVPHIITRGGEWFAGLGSKTQGGTRLYSVSGHVARPGVYEASVGITLRELIERAGGVANGRRLKAVVPGGSSAPLLTGRRDRRDHGRRRAPQRGDDGGLRGRGRHGRHHVHPRGAPHASPASTPTSPAGSARRAGSAPGGSTRSPAGSSPGRACPRTRTRSWTSPSAAPGARSAPSTTGRSVRTSPTSRSSGPSSTTTSATAPATSARARRRRRRAARAH